MEGPWGGAWEGLRGDRGMDLGRSWRRRGERERPRGHLRRDPRGGAGGGAGGRVGPAGPSLLSESAVVKVLFFISIKCYYYYN